MPMISPEAEVIPYLPRKKDAWWLLLVFLILATMLPFPLTDDTGHWHSMAYDLLHYGRWPYVGTWDQSFPGAILPHLLAQLVFGPSDLGFRVFDLIVQFGCTWMLFRFWRNWLDERTTILTILLWAFTYTRCTPTFGGMRDVYAAMLVIGAAFPFVRNEQQISWGSVFRSGLLIGIAVTLRPTNEAYAVLLALFTGLRKRPLQALILILLGLVPLVMTFAAYAFYPHALQEYWRATVLFNTDVYARITRPFGSFFRRLIAPKYLALSVLVGLFVQFRKRINVRQQHVQLYCAAIVASLIIVLVQRKYYPYHFAMYLVLMMPIGGIGLKRMLDHLPRRMVMPLFVTLFWLLSLPYESLLKHLQQGITPEMIAHSYQDAEWPDPYEAQTVEYVQTRTSINDRIEVCSFDPRLHLHMRRPSAGIYASIHPIGFAAPNGFTGYQHEWRSAYMDSLRLLAPKFIVLERRTSAETLSDPYAAVLHELPGFDSLLASSYDKDTTIGQNEIYRRLSP